MGAVMFRKTLFLFVILNACAGIKDNRSDIKMSGVVVVDRDMVVGGKHTVIIFDKDHVAKCTGVLIKGNRVLTAGHCHFPEGMAYVSPSLSKETNVYLKALVIADLSEKTKDLKFNFDGNITTAMLNDLKILQMENDVLQSYGITPAKLGSKHLGEYPVVNVLGFGDGFLFDENGFELNDPKNHLKAAKGKTANRPRLGNLKGDNYNSRAVYLSKRLMGIQLDLVTMGNRGVKQPSACAGDSGGGVFNENGELVGINVAVPDKILLRGLFNPRPELTANCKAGYSYAMDLKPFHGWIETLEYDDLLIDQMIPLREKVPTGDVNSNKSNGANITIVNDTNMLITELYLAADYANFWGQNVMLDKPLFANEILKQRIDDKTCNYEIKYTSVGENLFSKETIVKFDFCNGNIFSITY